MIGARTESIAEGFCNSAKDPRFTAPPGPFLGFIPCVLGHLLVQTVFDTPKTPEIRTHSYFYHLGPYVRRSVENVKVNRAVIILAETLTACRLSIHDPLPTASVARIAALRAAARRKRERHPSNSTVAPHPPRVVELLFDLLCHFCLPFSKFLLCLHPRRQARGWNQRDSGKRLSQVNGSEPLAITDRKTSRSPETP